MVLNSRPADAVWQFGRFPKWLYSFLFFTHNLVDFCHIPFEARHVQLMYSSLFFAFKKIDLVERFLVSCLSWQLNGWLVPKHRSPKSYVVWILNIQQWVRLERNIINRCNKLSTGALSFDFDIYLFGFCSFPLDSTGPLCFWYLKNIMNRRDRQWINYIILLVLQIITIIINVDVDVSDSESQEVSSVGLTI